MTLDVDMFECLSDNYGYLVHDPASGATAAIDAPEEAPIRAALARTGWKLTDIFVTHHHADHTDGIAGLKAEFGAKVTGPRAEADKISGLDTLVGGGDEVTLGNATFKIFDTPGHTLGHIVYFAPDSKILFAADALFSLGCGRMFEGTPGPMWLGLKTLRDLSDETQLYAGHEYTAANAKFALSIDPDNPALIARADEITRQRAENSFTMPVSLGQEKAINPFLRADDPEIARLMQLPDADPAEVFAAIRKAKDNF